MTTAAKPPRRPGKDRRGAAWEIYDVDAIRARLEEEPDADTADLAETIEPDPA